MVGSAYGILASQVLDRDHVEAYWLAACLMGRAGNIPLGRYHSTRGSFLSIRISQIQTKIEHGKKSSRMDVVKGHERLTDIFGRWPSFHDSEVISIRPERRGRDQWEGPIVYVSVHVFEGYRETERLSEVKWRNHAIVTFRFATVVDMSFERIQSAERDPGSRVQD
jgi:hypothetical protein